VFGGPEDAFEGQANGFPGHVADEAGDQVAFERVAEVATADCLMIKRYSVVKVQHCICNLQASFWIVFCQIVIT
jgi:hypothetical protein